MENTTLTQRIVGAIVILSLAIIFIPALLETDKLDLGRSAVSPIPEVPREISTIVFQLNESNGKFEGEGLTASEQLTAAVSKAIENSANEVEITEPETTETKRTEAGAGKSASSANIEEADKQHSWMLQVASFKNADNALNLRDRLRAKQYVAHVDERKLSSGSIWRVRVGPVLSREKIVKMQSMLEKEMKLKGLIIRRR